jgi:C4-dicarboxylate-binding protein DctP
MRLIAACLAVVLTLVAGSAPAFAKKVLRVTMTLPLKGALGQNMLQFKEEIERATGGGIEVQIFDSGQLHDEKDASSAVASGQIEMGVVSLSRFAGEIPAVDVFHIPFLFDSDAKLRAAVLPGSAVRGPLDQAIERSGVRVLWWQAYGGTVLLSKGGQAVRSPVDLKGRKVRVLGPVLAAWVEANGGSAISVIGSDQYYAYQQGKADVGMTSPATIKSRRIWEVMDTVTAANVAATEYIVIVNARVLAELSAAEQAVVTAAAQSAEARLRTEFIRIERDAIDVCRRNKMTVYAPNAVEMEAFRRSADGVRTAFVKRSGPLGASVLAAAQALK